MVTLTRGGGEWMGRLQFVAVQLLLPPSDWATVFREGIGMDRYWGSIPSTTKMWQAELCFVFI